MFRALYAFSGDLDVASDAVAEAFTQLIRRGPSVRDPAGWAWRTAFPITKGALKDRRLTAATLTAEPPTTTTTTTPTSSPRSANCPTPRVRRSSSSTTRTSPPARSHGESAATASPCAPIWPAAGDGCVSSWVMTMDDLRRQFATLDAVPMPDIRAEIDERLRMEPPTVRVTTTRGTAARRRTLVLTPLVLMLLVGLLITAVVAGSLIGGWLNNLTPNELPTSSPATTEPSRSHLPRPPPRPPSRSTAPPRRQAQPSERRSGDRDPLWPLPERAGSPSGVRRRSQNSCSSTRSRVRRAR